MQFNILFDPASPDLGGLTAPEQQAVLDTANAAATIWSWYLTSANITLDLQITVDNSLFGGNILAVGGPADYLATGATFGGKAVYDTNTAIELRTGVDQNGSAADLGIGLTVDAIRDMYFKTDPNGAVLSGYYDARSVFLHEIAHGLGFSYGSDDPSFPGVAVFDTFVQNNTFTGPNAETAYSSFSQPIRLNPLSLSHFDNWGSLSSDLMSASIPPDTNRGISFLDLGVLQDIGVSLNLPTSGDDVIHDVAGRYGVLLNLFLGAGNDTGYAIPSGGSRIFGEDGDDRLFGDKGSDYFDGGNGNDNFYGGGGIDIIFGGANLDVARYSGLASDYQITRITDWTTEVKDLRPGSPDGTDTLYDVERLQWGDGSFFNLNRPPVLTTQPLSSPKNQLLSLTQLAGYYDPDNNAVTKYQLLDTSADPNSGYFIVDGVVQAANTVITVTLTQFVNTQFVTGTVGDDLQIRAFDGYYWSAPDNGPWVPFTVTITAGAPVVTVTNPTLGANQSFSLSSLFTVVATDGAPITQYRIWEGNNNPSSGYFDINGVVQPAFTTIDLTAAQLAQTFFVTGTAQDDDLRISASNGFYWSGTPTFHVSLSGPLNYRPELTLGTWNPQHTAFFNPLGIFTAQYNQILSPDAFSFTWDRDGDPITKYQLLDTTTDPNSGHWAINGVAQAAGAVLDLTPAQWAQTTFVTGVVGDVLKMRVFDGKNWSASSLNGSDFVPADIAWGTLNLSLAPHVITGTPGDDSLIGTAGDDQIYGLDGNDFHIVGGAGNDLMDGGPGDDMAIFSGVLADYTITLFRGGVTITGPDGTDTLVSIESAGFADQNIDLGSILDGTPGDDNLLSPRGNSEIYGYGGNDTIQGAGLLLGGDGDDMITGFGSLSGGMGNDRLDTYKPANSLLDGGPGSDLVSYNLIANQFNSTVETLTVDLTAGVASDPATGTDTLIGIEGVDVTGLGNATLIGDNGDNGLSAEVSGVQTILAGGGNDGIFSRFGSGGMFDGGSGINHLSLDRANRYTGTGYPLVGTPYVTPFTLAFTPGVSGVLPDGATYSNFDYLTLETGTGDDSVTFNQPKLPLDPTSSYFTSSNSWQAGDGTDTLTLDLSGRAESFTLIDGVGVGEHYASLRVPNVVSDVLFLTSVENYRITSGLGNDQYTTGPGDDLLNGGLGNDILDGGDGADTAVFAGNRSAYSVTRNPNGSYTISGPDGTDTLTNIEQLVFSDRTIAIGTGPGADFDGLGTSDLVLQSDSGRVAIWLLNGTTVVSGPLVSGNPGPTWHIKGTGDFNGDLKADVLWQNDSGQADIWLMNGTTMTSSALVGSNPGPSWHIKGSGDFDGDGKSDIVWQNDSGQAAIWLMNGTAMTGGALVGGNPGPSWHIKGSGDFDDDGKSDILWQNDSGQAAIWLLNGSTVSSSALIGANPGPAWQVVRAADTNGDGESDILWQGTNGQAVVWQMSGTNILTNAAIGPNPGTSWHMIAATS